MPVLFPEQLAEGSEDFKCRESSSVTNPNTRTVVTLPTDSDAAFQRVVVPSAQSRLQNHENFCRFSLKTWPPTFGSMRLSGKPSKCHNLPCSCPFFKYQKQNSGLLIMSVLQASIEKNIQLGAVHVHCSSGPPVGCAFDTRSNQLHRRADHVRTETRTSVNPAQRSKDTSLHVSTRVHSSAPCTRRGQEDKQSKTKMSH